MSQENQATNSGTPTTLVPVKRKRGRPRKDETLLPGENTSGMTGSDGSRRNRRRRVDSPVNADNDMVGHIVSGVLDGSFDAGYLLTVRVGDTGTVLRGVVFEPGLSVPVSAENDVAPHVKMFKREEIPFHIAEPLNQMPAFTSEQPITLHQRNEATILAERSSASLVPQVVPQRIPSEPLTGRPAEILQSVGNSLNHPPKGLSSDKSNAPEATPNALPERKTESLTTSITNAAETVAPLPHQAAESLVEKGESTDILPKIETDLPADTAVSGTNQVYKITSQDLQPLPLNEPLADMPKIDGTHGLSDNLDQTSPVAAHTLPLEPKIEKVVEILQENETSVQGHSNDADEPKHLKTDAEIELSGELLQGSTTTTGVPNTVNQENRTSPIDGPDDGSNQVPLVATQGLNLPSQLTNTPLTNDNKLTEEDLQSGEKTDKPVTELQGKPILDAQNVPQSGPATNQSALTQDAPILEEVPGKPLESVANADSAGPEKVAD